jgi:bifunctional non-homologous end joining protein LigD
MLALPAAPFDAADYSFEVKWDGVRALAAVASGRWSLWGRKGVDYTDRYPELAVLRRLPAGTVVDGELVVLSQGRADLPALLRRHQRRRPLRTSGSGTSVSYVLFDLLQWRGQELVNEPLAHRRERLHDGLRRLQEPLLSYSASVVEQGQAFFAQAVAQGHEGVMAKKLRSRYLLGQRSPAWRKIKPCGSLPCVIVGYCAGPSGIERLLVATVREGMLRYVGQVHRGLDAAMRAELARRLARRPRRQPVVACPELGCWVEPECYCQVRYTGWTGSGCLRYATFGGFLEPR